MVLKENSTPVCLENDLSRESIRMDRPVMVIGFSKVVLLTCAAVVKCRQVAMMIVNREAMCCTVFVFELTAAISIDADGIALLLVGGIEGSIDDIEYVG